jgi:hypothetical protein
MACYLGESKTVPALGESWHDFVSVFDSVSGRSPLCQMARMINDRRAVLEAGSSAIAIIGASPSDTALAGIDYALNLTRSPVRDFSTALKSCRDHILQLLVPWSNRTTGGLVNNDGERWGFNSGTTIRSDFEDAIDGLDFELVEDFQPILEAMRDALDATVSTTASSAPWANGRILLGVNNPNPTSPVYSQFELNPASITAPGAPHGLEWQIAIGAGDNEYGDRDVVGCGQTGPQGGSPPEVADLWVGFIDGTGGGVDPLTESVDSESDPAYTDICETDTLIRTGWLHLLEVTKLFRVTPTASLKESGSGTWDPVSPIPTNAKTSVSTSYSLAVYQPGGSTPSSLGVTHTPSGGSVTFGSSDSYKEYSIESELTIPALASTAEPFDSDGCNVRLEVAEDEFLFCVDSLNRWTVDS